MEPMLEKIMPNVVAYQSRFFTSLSQTMEMTVKSGILAFIFGLALGVILTVTRKGGIRPNAIVYRVQEDGGASAGSDDMRAPSRAPRG